jgi:hypothetical protein
MSTRGVTDDLSTIDVDDSVADFVASLGPRGIPLQELKDMAKKLERYKQRCL